MAKNIPFECFEDILEHSISNMKRIKKELALAEEIDSVDYIGLVIINTQKYRDDFVRTIGGVLRDSDVVACCKGGLAYLFLPGTNYQGLLDIFSDFKEFYRDTFDYVSLAVQLKEIKTAGDILSKLNGMAAEKGWGLK